MDIGLGVLNWTKVVPNLGSSTGLCPSLQTNISVIRCNVFAHKGKRTEQIAYLGSVNNNHRTASTSYKVVVEVV